MKNKFIVKIICILCVFFLSAPLCFASKQDTIQLVDKSIQSIIDYQKSQTNGYIINGNILENVFNFSDAKLVIALSQNGISDNYINYSSVLTNFISDKYRTNEKLYAMSVPAGAQISLALLACGINPYTIEGTNGKKYNFLAENIYDRDKAYSLGKGGVEGYAWGLIALDAYNYNHETAILKIREDLMASIIDTQLEDGTYASTDSTSPYYLSALSVLALSPDYNNTLRKEEIKEQTRKLKKEIDEKRKAEGIKITFEQYEKEYGSEEELTLYDYVDASVNKSLEILSEKQSEDGSYQNYAQSNIQTTSAVITALCALGIDPVTDERFIKNSNTLIDGLLTYQQADGSFKATEASRIDIETIDALAALVAYKRFLEGKGSLYDFSENILQQSTGILQVSQKDIENIRYINENFDLSLYPQICMIYEKVLHSKREDRLFLLSRITTIKEKKAQHESIINYVNDEGKELLYSEKGVNLSKKRQIRELLRICEALPERDKNHIYVYEDLISTTTRIENALALETLLFSLVLIVVASFILSILMFFIRKRAFANRVNRYNHFPQNPIGKVAAGKNIKQTTLKDKRMPFELEDTFFEYDLPENEAEIDPDNKPLPFEEDSEFFDYEMSIEETVKNVSDDSFQLPFENEEDNNFFEYESTENNIESEKTDDKDMLPFEKEKEFFKYK